MKKRSAFNILKDSKSLYPDKNTDIVSGATITRICEIALNDIRPIELRNVDVSNTVTQTIQANGTQFDC